MSAQTGHPAHQVREFTVHVRRGEESVLRLKVRAQTKADAVLRAGIMVAQRISLGGDAEEWIALGVDDPANRRAG